jgi:3-oxoacyl-[acyl-carrier protein] reductase
MQVKDSVVVITGAASGIGEAAAVSLALLGASIVLCDLNEERLTAICEKIGTANGKACYKVVDVTNEAQVQSAMDFAVSQFGCINVVLACAGIIKDGFFVNPDKETGKVKKFMTTDQFQSVLNVNLTGVFITLREAAIRMIDNDWKGVLIPISSINKAGELGQLNYASTKAAIALWPKILAGEFHIKQIRNIRVAAIAPGYVETPMLTSIKPEILDAIISGIPIGRLVQTDEIVSSIRFIIENEAIHGTTLEIAGGIIAKGLAK